MTFACRAIVSTAPPGGSWGVGIGYAIGAAVTTSKPVVAIVGDSAFGFSGMEVETICRYLLPIVTVVLNNSIYRGVPIGIPCSPTRLMRGERYDKMIEAFGGDGYHAADTKGLAAALGATLAAKRPALINAVIDPAAGGTESGRIEGLNPKSALTGAKAAAPIRLPR